MRRSESRSSTLREPTRSVSPSIFGGCHKGIETGLQMLGHIAPRIVLKRICGRRGELDRHVGIFGERHHVAGSAAPGCRFAHSGYRTLTHATLKAAPPRPLWWFVERASPTGRQLRLRPCRRPRLPAHTLGAIGAKRTCREHREPVDLTKMTRKRHRMRPNRYLYLGEIADPAIAGAIVGPAVAP